MKAEQAKVHKLPTAVLGLDVSSDAKTLYAACMDGGIYQLDAASGATKQLTKHESYASGVCLVAESNTLISSGYDGVLRWHDLASGKMTRQVNAHQFWSWQTALSPDGKVLASVTGQYLAGGPKYEPAPETEPSVKIFDASTGATLKELTHVPSTQAVAFSPDNQYLAAGNLMGEIRVWEVSTGKNARQMDDVIIHKLGIIKSHCYQGGVFSLAFTPDDQHVIACGMGPMRDPMAGNGKQTWQKFAWNKPNAPKVDEIHDGDHGNGHPESLAYHPSKKYFVMAGRMAQGKWNAGFFDEKTGALVQSVDTKCRLTKAVFSDDGSKLFLSGATGQPKAKNGKYDDFGRVFVYQIT